ncbi:hypothetical protein [Arcanobacterium pinnipediorum]|uniref:Bacteriocin biosynthesis cyclodehydratase domain-containing protein n=1 Tax=Arcanobacterium pinnipediorum TaxID=1503041 RepID=A0ABY5AHU1_9ACTO|nr:hypothetical protein [Arcanobacterium pinnipediorum]USR79758.1 hypothetical protein NG665_01845 [Arcanobacterium pinnipediorum]
MQIKPGLPVVWRETDQIQIGLDPRSAVILNGLTAQELHFVDSLSASHSDIDLSIRARTHDVSLERARSIIAMLERSGVLTRETAASADSAAHLRLHNRISQSRQRAHVVFPRGDYLSTAAAVILRDAGITALSCRDTSMVGSQDHRLLATDYLGIPRYLAFRSALNLTTDSPEVLQPPTVVVETGSYSLNPAHSAQWLSAGIPIVHGWVEEIDVVVGPTTIAHESACTSCIYLHRCDVDPAWSRLAMQMFGRPDIRADLSSMELGAALIAREVLALIDGEQPALLNKLSVIGPQPAPPALCDISVHPQCGCQDFAD